MGNKPEDKKQANNPIGQVHAEVLEIEQVIGPEEYWQKSGSRVCNEGRVLREEARLQGNCLSHAIEARFRICLVEGRSIIAVIIERKRTRGRG